MLVVANLAHAAVEEPLGYVRDQRAFGRPIGPFQHSRFALAELVTILDVAQAYVDRCVQAHTAGKLTPVDAAKAKWWSVEVQNSVPDAWVQPRGGYGYMQEYQAYKVARAWFDARVTKIWAGSDETRKEVIRRDLRLGEVSR